MIHDEMSFPNTVKESFKLLSMADLRPVITVRRLQKENKGFLKKILGQFYNQIFKHLWKKPEKLNKQFLKFILMGFLS